MAHSRIQKLIRRNMRKVATQFGKIRSPQGMLLRLQELHTDAERDKVAMEHGHILLRKKTWKIQSKTGCYLCDTQFKPISREHFSTRYLLDTTGNMIGIPKNYSTIFQLEESFRIQSSPRCPIKKIKVNKWSITTAQPTVEKEMIVKSSSVFCSYFYGLIAIDSHNDYNRQKRFLNEYPHYVGKFVFDEKEANQPKRQITVYSKKKKWEALNNGKGNTTIKPGLYNALWGG